ncbi:MAG: hypothetical protein V3W04_07410 [Gammaproteobacteria bacterium]
MKPVNLLLTVAICASFSVNAATIDTMTITNATLTGDRVPGGSISFDPVTYLISPPGDPILVADDFTVSRPSSISGDVDSASQSISLDLSSWILNDLRSGGISQDLGYDGAVTGSWDGSHYEITWESLLTKTLISAPETSFYVTWTIEGTATAAETNPIPLPGALWLLGSGILGFVGYKRYTPNT